MISSTACSSRRRALGAALLVAGTAACAHKPAPTASTGPPPRIVVLPIDNLSGTSPPMKSLVAAIDAALGVKFELVQGDTLERFLSRHRIRFTCERLT